MQGILETPGPTVPGNLEHGQVKEAPKHMGHSGASRVKDLLMGSLRGTQSEWIAHGSF
jgi:hypothetical protein